MNRIYNDVTIDLINTSVKATNQKTAFQALASLVANEIGYPAESLYHLFIDKEYHSNSGIGGGVAIPQFKLQGMQKSLTAMIVLESPINFNAPDNKPVDIICAVFSPQKDGVLHLRKLARQTRTMKDSALCAKIRDAQDPDIIRSLMTSPEGWMIAA